MDNGLEEWDEAFPAFIENIKTYSPIGKVLLAMVLEELYPILERRIKNTGRVVLHPADNQIVIIRFIFNQQAHYTYIQFLGDAHYSNELFIIINGSSPKKAYTGSVNLDTSRKNIRSRLNKWIKVHST